MLNQEQIAKLHNGLFKVPLKSAKILMPELIDAWESFPEKNEEDYVVDVKVHMLMPDQFPCIPNWHFDMVPRDSEGKQDFDQIDDSKPMYLWLSGKPLTRFRKDGLVYDIEPRKWVSFTQRDEHQGVMSTDFQWRVFIRICHKDILKAAPRNEWLRRHSQVYLDASNFKW